MIVEAGLVIAGGLLLYGSYGFILDKFVYKRLPPGPTPLPYIGSGYCMGNENEKPWRVFRQLADEYGPVYTFYFGQTRFIMLHGPQMIREAIVTKARYFSTRPGHFMPGYGDNYVHGVINSRGEKWTINRKFALSGLRHFGLGKLAIVSKIQTEADYLMAELDTRQGQTEYCFDDLIQNTVFNIIGSLVFGCRSEYGDPEFQRLRRAGQVFFERPVKENMLHTAIPAITLFSLPPQVKDFQVFEQCVRSWVLQELEKRSKEPPKQSIDDFLDLYLTKENSNVSFDSFIGVVSDFYLAGTETTASSIVWAILYLCKWPHFQRKCQEEIDKVITAERMPTNDDREKMPFIEAFLAEIQRHVTLVPNAVFHAVQEDTDVELGGFEIPPYSAVVYNIWALHHDWDYWVDPAEFRPERWLDARGEKLLDHSSHYIPFGVGPRICLGEALAKIEYFIYIVAMLQRFNFEFPSEDYDVDLDSGRFSMTNVPPKFELTITRRK